MRKPRTHYARIDGYRLEVPADWYLLSPAEIRDYANGVGPARWPQGARTILDRLTGYHAPATVHDLEQDLGRTEDDRRAGDLRFLRNMCRVLWADFQRAVRSAWKRPGVLAPSTAIWGIVRLLVVRLLLARALYRLLRLCGRQAFNAAPKLDLSARRLLLAMPPYSRN